MRPFSRRGSLLAVVAFAAAMPAAIAQPDDPSLAAIVRHPIVAARLKAAKIQLVWMALPVENNRACYMLKEDHPTHMATVGQYCFDRSTSKVLEYDVAADRYIELHMKPACRNVPARSRYCEG